MEYCLGLIAGEGCFTIGVRHADGKLYPCPSAVVKLKDNDYKSISLLRERFDNIGKINDINGRDMVQWRVSDKDGLSHLVETIRNADCKGWELSHKYENFQTWAKIVDVYCDGDTTSEDAVKMFRIARDKLNMDNGRDVDWDAYISEARQNPYGFICGAEKSSSNGVCERTVPSEGSTCWDH
jgi:hypothetical protein